IEQVKDELRTAGYKGEKVVIMASNAGALAAIGAVAGEMLKRVGMDVEIYVVEFNAMLQRRNRRGPVSEGGWSAFVTNWAGMDWLNPAVHMALRADGSYAG
uniref:hypothetical protein n=1 Tax=Klebsiella pneumoniae TaxID=573 RepID=UPI001952A4AD